MTKEQLINLIDKLDENSLRHSGIFGIYQYGGGPDESYIKANKEGLQMFALELLKASNKFEDDIIANEEKSISLNYLDNWIDPDSEIYIDYIEQTSKELIAITNTKKETLADKLTPYGCGAVAILLGISILVGLANIFDYLSDLIKNLLSH